MAIRSNIKNLESGRKKYSQRIRLLSGGYVNPQAFPDGEITVFPWNIEIDSWLVERGQKSRRTLLWDLCAKLCDLNGCAIEKFLLGDVNTVILVSRAIAQNNTVIVRPVCTSCNAENYGELKVPDQLEKIGEKKSDYVGFDTITLPDCKDVVSIRPLTVGDHLSVHDRTPEQKRAISDIIAMYLVPVVSINDTTPDKLQELVEWWNALHPSDQEYLISQENALYPHLNQEISWTCDQCQHDFSFTLAFDEKFFRRGGHTKS